ncbi:MAG: CHASE2 domain-containing protein [Phycisphaerae bacterium]|nr:CHASE2 domain-containing protein [Phycisphaerae bacterium]
MIKHKRLESWQAFGVGAAATAAVLVVYALGGLDWLELKTLDLRYLYANSIPESSQLVCIDIDDDALNKVGRWPWSRDVQAAIISILGEVGVKALLVDITLGEAEPVRTIVPRQADIAHDPLGLGTVGASIALPDHELRLAIADVGQVYLATDYALGGSWKNFLESDDFRGILEAREADDDAEARRLARTTPKRQTKKGEPAWAPLDWARMVVTLQAEPTLAAEQLARQLDVEQVDRALEPCRALALRRRMRAWFAADPQRWTMRPQELYHSFSKDLVHQAARYDEQVAMALREVLSHQATTRTEFVPVAKVAAAARPVDAISAVYFMHARAAKRCGFVVFESDVDSVVRQMRLLVQHEGRVLPQLALAVAFDELDLHADDIECEPGRLILHRRDGSEPLVIQIDEKGRALVPWVPRPEWSRQFGDHIPIVAVWQVHDRRQSIGHNNRNVQMLLEELFSRKQLLAHQQYGDDLKQRLKLDGQLREARYLGDEETVTDNQRWIAEYDELLAEGQAGLRADLAREIEHAATQPAEQRDAASQAYLDKLRLIQGALATNDEYRAEIESTLTRLRKRVSGKIGLIGYTATALADMTPIPTHWRAPGVMAHANLLNGLLSGRMVYWAPPWLNILPAVLLGMLVTAISVRWGPRTAALATLLLVGFIVLAGGLVFYVWTFWIAVTPAVGTLAASYVAVLAYRYLFLERERRQLATSLGQYTSATLARKMAEDPELCKRAETREVTAVFTDLAGFTTISERIGAERTQNVLNVSLGRFSDVMLRYEGMINKFIGDGIFAFWNPVIYPQPDHAVRACETAVELMTALRELRDEQRQAGGDEVFGELVMRIGVATGSAVVGPCGSEQKYDYTCIGDSVNVAARLESANKFYGTRILISGATYEQTGERFAARSLGGVQVKGKTQGVPIYELLGRTGEVADEVLHYAERFGQAVAGFQRRDWTKTLEAFQACLEQRPDDLAARQYADAIRQYMSQPPGDDWNGALELTEK